MYSETFVSLLWHERNVPTLSHGVIIDGVMGAYLQYFPFKFPKAICDTAMDYSTVVWRITDKTGCASKSLTVIYTI